MAELTIPAGPDDLTPEWLTRALGKTGAIAHSNIVDCRPERLGQGQGFVGQIYRFTLEYNVPDNSLPRTLVAKFSSPDRGLRLLTFELNQTEVRFYQEIAPQVQLHTPHLYYGAADPDTKKTVLLLEDITGATGGDNVADCSTEEARLAIRQIGEFHAYWWKSPRLQEMSWLPAITSQMWVPKAFQRRWAIFADRFGGQMPPALLQAAAVFGGHMELIEDRLMGRPITMIHGDYRLDNLFFGRPETGSPLTVFDWQVARKGLGPMDIAYFMAWCLEPEHRRREEVNLLKDYHRSLLQNGVRGYGFDQCQRDYRLSLFHPLAMLITAGAILDFTSDRGRKLIDVLIERVTAILSDHRVVKMLPEGPP